ncbi:hypothetical protein PAXRUDRAFT_769942, partial [Paxillus rubicundulus Ve08.2h10]
LRILIKRKLTDHDITLADQFLRDYGTELIKLYGSGSIKQNHHYATHVGKCAHDFGPLHDFWTFLFERLNKILKSFKTNNHGNGELETTFFKEFQRTCELVMLKASNEERGTVAGLAALSQELDDVNADGQVPIHVYGEILEIFQFEQDLHVGVGESNMLWFARMRWFKCYQGEWEGIWTTFESVDVRLWELGEYVGPDSQLPQLIDLDWMQSLLGRTTVSLGDDRRKAWATIDLAKVCVMIEVITVLMQFRQ